MTTKGHPVKWRKSSHSAQGANCVEVASIAGSCAVRDSKETGGPILHLTRQQWSTLLGIIKADE